LAAVSPQTPELDFKGPASKGREKGKKERKGGKGTKRGRQGTRKGKKRKGGKKGKLPYR